MKANVTYRIGGVQRNIAPDGLRLPDTYRVNNEVFECDSVEELFSMFPPVKVSENLKKAAQDFLNGLRDSLIYNFRKGNSVFYR